jgi:hypothetical protein
MVGNSSRNRKKGETNQTSAPWVGAWEEEVLMKAEAY